jgi:hypothetical protein
MRGVSGRKILLRIVKNGQLLRYGDRFFRFELTHQLTCFFKVRFQGSGYGFLFSGFGHLKEGVHWAQCGQNSRLTLCVPATAARKS